MQCYQHYHELQSYSGSDFLIGACMCGKGKEQLSLGSNAYGLLLDTQALDVFGIILGCIVSVTLRRRCLMYVSGILETHLGPLQTTPFSLSRVYLDVANGNM